jgi:thioredoxin 2
MVDAMGTGDASGARMAMPIRICTNCGRKNRVPPAALTKSIRCGACKTILGPLSAPLDADTSMFDQVIGAGKFPILVDFWAAWCGPCRMAAPEVERVAKDMAGRAVVLKVDTDKYPEVANRYGVRGIPNFVVLRDGRVVRQQAGVVPHDEMKRWLELAETTAQV